MSSGLLPICFTCARYRGVVPDIGYSCDAFSAGIPVEILSSRADHRQPFAGDSGLTYVALEQRLAREDADTKRSKSSVDYTDFASNPTEQCRKCVHFLTDAEGPACESVHGDISPVGWCKLFLVSQTRGDRADIETLLGRLHERRTGEPVQAAGIIFMTPDRQVLLLRRTGEGDAEGEWAFPGGKLEPGETAEQAARRECREEIGIWPNGDLVEWTRRIRNGVDFTTFVQRVAEPFEPKLNEEHDAHEWVSMADLGRSDDFVESEHPRAPDGEFTTKGGGGRSSAAAHLVSEPDKTKWPLHIRKLKIPPAWTNVRISPDPKAPLQASGYDSKGRAQRVYSERFRNSQTAKKFQRIKVLDRKFDTVAAQNQRGLRSRNPTIREHAAVTALVMDMGLRPGSERDTGAEKQAFGATTLRAEHVVTEGKTTKLRFTGKKGVELDLSVTDEALAADLRERAKRGGQLFPDVSASSLRRYVGSLGNCGFKTKDLRTLKGTRIAQSLVEKEPTPTSETAYKKAVKRIATDVAKALGNTPAVALSAYISPVVFAGWREGLSSAGQRQAA